MKDLVNGLKSSINQRSFMKKGLAVPGAAIYPDNPTLFDDPKGWE